MDWHCCHRLRKFVIQDLIEYGSSIAKPDSIPALRELTVSAQVALFAKLAGIAFFFLGTTSPDKNLKTLSNFSIVVIVLVMFFGAVIYFGLKRQDNHHNEY